MPAQVCTSFFFAVGLSIATFISGCSDAMKESDSESGQVATSDSQAELIEEERVRAMTLASGKRIAERLESECDYWGIDKYNPDGTATISKSFYTTWGGKFVVMLPWASWESLSGQERADLTAYLSSERRVKNIIAGNVTFSDLTARNTITVDSVVWP